MMWHGWGMGWGGMLLGFLFLLLLLGLLVLLIGLIVWLIVRGRSGQTGLGRPGTPYESPLDTLHNRYARGEISREEYLAMKQDLES
jgi:putative membrane protein